MKRPEIAEVRDLLDYEPSTGEFRWRRRAAARVRAGDIAGCERDGYWQLCVKNGRVLGHLVAWAIHYGEWPAGEVDHINGIGTDNRIVNLRLASRHQNMRNTRRRSNNTSGIKGVSWRSDSQRWRATLRTAGGRLYLGSFDSVDAAADAVQRARAAHHGEFARHD